MIAALKLVPVWVWRVLVLIVALCAGSFSVAWFWQANAYGKVIASNEASRQADLALIANAGAQQAREAVDKQQKAEQALANLDSKNSQERDALNVENESLCRANADGNRRLRIAGTCSSGSSGSNVSKATSATSVGNAATIELSQSAGQSVFDIRAGIIADQAALRAAQAYIREVCQ